MDSKLPEALGQLYVQLKEELQEEHFDKSSAGQPFEQSNNPQTVRLAKEIEGVAEMIGASSVQAIGPVKDITAFSLGPAPTHCTACGQLLPEKR